MQKKRFQLSLDIVHCDGFVNAPATAQALYVQLVSVCDDEGFTSQLELCKFMAHAKDCDVEYLVNKEFIYLVGPRKVCVIKHWRMNTWMRNQERSTFAERSLVYVNEHGNYTLNSNEGTPLEQRANSGNAANEQRLSSNGTAVEQSESSRGRVAHAERPCPPNADVPIQSNPYHTNTYQSNNNPLHSIPLDSSPLDSIAKPEDADALDAIDVVDGEPPAYDPNDPDSVRKMNAFLACKHAKPSANEDEDDKPF